jgi:hypothetical protein
MPGCNLSKEFIEGSRGSGSGVRNDNSSWQSGRVARLHPGAWEVRENVDEPLTEESLRVERNSQLGGTMPTGGVAFPGHPDSLSNQAVRLMMAALMDRSANRCWRGASHQTRFNL